MTGDAGLRAAREAALRRRTQLFVPANKPDFVPKAAASGAVRGVRDTAADLLVLVRVNSDDDLAPDIDAAVGAGADGVLVPMVDSGERVRLVDDLVTRAETSYGVAAGTVEVQLLVETCRGLLAIDDIAATGARTTALMLGGEDLAAELEVDPTSEGFDVRWAHGLVLCAARAHGLAPYGLMRSLADFRDLPGLARDAREARDFGYVGSLCIHPAQVPVLAAAFSPSDEEVANARRVLEALAEGERRGTAAVSLDGRMVDTPMAARARRLLARAGDPSSSGAASD